MTTSKIEWTDSTWNPLTGCTKISPGCKNCYAERMAKRLRLMGQKNYVNGFELTLHEDTLNKPLAWNRPKLIFVNSMSDIFHENVPISYTKKIFRVMREANWHTFQVLTKRSEILCKYNDVLEWPDNVWMGVSVENEDYKFRISHLVKSDARIKFLSLEPLIGPVGHLDLTGIDWVIVGGESGPGARPMKEEWVMEIKDQCHRAGVPFFFKQWGGFNKKRNGRMLQGRTWDELPLQLTA